MTKHKNNGPGLFLPNLLLIRCAVVVAALILASCGGGSSQGNSPPPPPPPPGSSANVPTITAPPASQTVAAGASASFTVSATGNGTLTYAWRFNGSPIPGAAATTLSFPAGATVADAGSYDCVVTNSLDGTTATTTTTAVSLTVVVQPDAPTLSGETAVLPATAGHVVATNVQAGATYDWSIVNGAITAGQGTNQITYTAGHLGRAVLVLSVSNLAGVKMAVRNIVVSPSLPIDTLFAQNTVHPGSTGILASAPAIDGQSYAWSIQNITASATIVGSQTSTSLKYNTGVSPGLYQLTLGSTSQAGHAATASRGVAVSRNVFLKDPRDASSRSLHTATLLNDGRILVTGGDAGVPDYDTLVPAVGTQSQVLGTAEIFDPSTRTWAAVSSLSPRLGHTATLLDDGRVLVAGGTSSPTGVMASVEIYDPTTRAWTSAMPMGSARAFHTATLLTDGRVLVIGGDANGAIATAEIYDPAGNTWTPAGTMNVARVLHSAVRMQNGIVLVAAGRNAGGLLASAELYDPTANAWRSAASMPSARSAVGAVLLPSGKVLVLGSTSLLYDPATDAWEGSEAPTPPPVLRGVQATDAILLPDGRVLATGGYFHQTVHQQGIFDPTIRRWTSLSSGRGSYSSATVLPDGKILNVGGIGEGSQFVTASDFQSLATASLFDPTLDVRVTLGSGAHAGADSAAEVMSDGRVLVTGGNTSRISTASKATATADIFDPTTNEWSTAASMATARASHKATALGDGQVLVTGGNRAFVGVFATAERYNPQTNAWSAAGTMSSQRYKHSSTLINGRVLVAGGSSSITPCTCTTFERTADIYDSATNTWAPTGALVTARYGHTATRLGNDMILVAGGFGGIQDTLHAGGAALASAELYDPALGVWSTVAPMTVARTEHTATLLDSGLVLVSGGTDGTTTYASAEVYDPVSNAWTAVAPMTFARQSHTGLRLPSGLVLVVGGFNSTSSPVFGVQNGETYDAVGNQWLAAGPMAVPRQHFAVAPLANGRVVIVGGAPNHSGVPEFYE